MFKSLRHSMLVKVGALVLLTLLLCIPLSEIGSLIRERGNSRNEAAQELAQTYAGSQTLVGPLLVVPYTERWTEDERNDKGRVTGRVTRSAERMHIVFPDKLAIDGSMTPQERYRGIFKIPFYTLDATLEGGFAPFDAKTLPHHEKNSTLEFGGKAPFALLSVTDLRGLDGSPTLTMGDEALRFAQGVPELAGIAAPTQGIHAPLAGSALVAWQKGEALPFKLKLGLVGQETFSMVPAADETTAHITSPWAHPSFGGRFLAAERSVTPDGFDAHWRVSALVSSAREQVRSALTDGASTSDNRTPLDTFNVSLAEPLNVYAMSTRAVKYGALFVGLVLMAGFMFELFRKLRLHPVQYGLVGLSIALFFLLLVALSEKLLFWQAYAVAASASVLLLAVYFSAALQGWRRGVSFAAYVALLYGALYGLLASESNALLLGAVLVFGMLAALMVATRKVDWYALSTPEAVVDAAEPAALSN
ncbi:MAG: cell envelope integrity protein CreD [Comamonadaceae bacterium]|nr:MAG: cell envelope integrity protein CreD [Comamonadaceae bacterium]